MLYLRWLETSRRYGKRPAIFGNGQVVSFADLAGRAASAPAAEGPVIARSGGPDFFVEVLRGWRDGQAVIPVERDGSDPILAKSPPAGTALVKYTPGATGIPRGIFFNAPQVVADCDRLVRAMALSPAAPNLAVISLAHSYGFSSVVLPLLLHGVPVHLVPVPFPKALEEAFRAHDRVVLPAVPSMWRAWHRSGVLASAPISLAVSAGAPLSLELEHEMFNRSKLKLRNFYGASECGGISFDRTEVPRTSASDVGTLLDGVRTSVGAGGRIVVESDSVACGYDISRDDDRLGDGTYLTRDIGEVDDVGHLHLAGSACGAINVAGRKVSPAKVEAALQATGLVERVRVIGIPSANPERHEEIAVLYQSRDGVMVDELKRAASGHLRNWEMPRHWRAAPGWWSLDPVALRRAFRGDAGFCDLSDR